MERVWRNGPTSVSVAGVAGVKGAVMCDVTYGCREVPAEYLLGKGAGRVRLFGCSCRFS